MNPSLSGRIEDCIVLWGDELEPFLCSVFEYKEGIITRMETDAPTAIPVGSRPVLTPGFVNGHTHIGDCFLPDAATSRTLAEAFFRPDGYKYQALARIDREDHVDRMTEFLRGMAASGVIAAFDFREQGVEGARRLREAERRTGVRAVALSQFDHSPFAPEALEKNTDPLPDSVLSELEAILAESDGFSESTMNDLTDTAWKQISTAAGSAGKGTAIHCLENEDYRSTSIQRTGRGDLSRAIDLLRPDLIVHLTVANAEEIQRIARAGIPVVVNPRANAVLGLPPPPVLALMRSGLPVLLGTDNGMLNGPNLFSELDFTYRLACSQAGEQGERVAPVEILKMVTVNAARSRWGGGFPGTLVEGGPASFVQFDFSDPQLSYSRDLLATLVTRCQPAHVLRTVSGGKTIHPNNS